MKLSPRFALALLLGTTLATALSSCDYKWSPGVNPQFVPGFSNPPGYHTADVNRDSINNQLDAPEPIGVGSAKSIRNGSTKEKMESAPAGSNTTSSQSPSGQVATPERQAQATK